MNNHPLSVNHHPLSVNQHLLSANHHPLSVNHHPLSVNQHLLSANHHPLSVNHHPLSAQKARLCCLPLGDDGSDSVPLVAELLQHAVEDVTLGVRLGAAVLQVATQSGGGEERRMLGLQLQLKLLQHTRIATPVDPVDDDNDCAVLWGVCHDSALCVP